MREDKAHGRFLTSYVYFSERGRWIIGRTVLRLRASSATPANAASTHLTAFTFILGTVCMKGIR